MVDDTVCEIRKPWMLMVGETSAVVVTQTFRDDRGYELALDWKTVSIAHMMELSDADSSASV